METKFWQVSRDEPQQDIIELAALMIREGKLVAFPTETVYGLGANGLDSQAVQKIFAAKGRPGDNPLILHVAEIEDVYTLARQVPPAARMLMEKFWPGPLTFVLPKKELIPDAVTAGLDTVAIRMPDHPVARALIKKAGVPIAAPSANRSGYPSPTQAGHVWDDLKGKIDGVLDGGATGIGLESTVLDMSEELPVILRPGGITKEEIAETVGKVYIDPGLYDTKQVPKAPGMKYTHYSPRAQVILVQGTPENTARCIREMVKEYDSCGKKVGLLLTTETWEKIKNIKVFYHKNIGSRHNLLTVAHLIYSELRNCDKAGVDVILTETYEEQGLGTALMNRLLKSAGHHVIEA